MAAAQVTGRKPGTVFTRMSYTSAEFSRPAVEWKSEEPSLLRKKGKKPPSHNVAMAFEVYPPDEQRLDILEDVARKLQAIARGRNVRKWIHTYKDKRHDSAVRLQSVARGNMERMTTKKRSIAIVRIQRWYRSAYLLENDDDRGYRERLRMNRKSNIVKSSDQMLAEAFGECVVVVDGAKIVQRSQLAKVCASKREIMDIFGVPSSQPTCPRVTSFDVIEDILCGAGVRDGTLSWEEFLAFYSGRASAREWSTETAPKREDGQKALRIVFDRCGAKGLAKKAQIIRHCASNAQIAYELFGIPALVPLLSNEQHNAREIFGATFRNYLETPMAWEEFHLLALNPSGHVVNDAPSDRVRRMMSFCPPAWGDDVRASIRQSLSKALQTVTERRSDFGLASAPTSAGGNDTNLSSPGISDSGEVQLEGAAKTHADAIGKLQRKRVELVARAQANAHTTVQATRAKDAKEKDVGDTASEMVESRPAQSPRQRTSQNDRQTRPRRTVGEANESPQRRPSGRPSSRVAPTSSVARGSVRRTKTDTFRNKTSNGPMGASRSEKDTSLSNSEVSTGVVARELFEFIERDSETIANFHALLRKASYAIDSVKSDLYDIEAPVEQSCVKLQRVCDTHLADARGIEELVYESIGWNSVLSKSVSATNQTLDALMSERLDLEAADLANEEAANDVTARRVEELEAELAELQTSIENSQALNNPEVDRQAVSMLDCFVSVWNPHMYKLLQINPEARTPAEASVVEYMREGRPDHEAFNADSSAAKKRRGGATKQAGGVAHGEEERKLALRFETDDDKEFNHAMLEVEKKKERTKAAQKKASKKQRSQMPDEAYDVSTAQLKDTLFKLGSAGDPLNNGDWREREFFLTADNNVVYTSKKDGYGYVILFSSLELESARVHNLPDGSSCRSFAFQVELAADDDEAVVLAAKTAEGRDLWLERIRGMSKETSLAQPDKRDLSEPDVASTLEQADKPNQLGASSHLEDTDKQLKPACAALEIERAFSEDSAASGSSATKKPRTSKRDRDKISNATLGLGNALRKSGRKFTTTSLQSTPVTKRRWAAGSRTSLASVGGLSQPSAESTGVTSEPNGSFRQKLTGDSTDQVAAEESPDAHGSPTGNAHASPNNEIMPVGADDALVLPE
jgi:hypothetical protein